MFKKSETCNSKHSLCEYVCIYYWFRVRWLDICRPYFCINYVVIKVFFSPVGHIPPGQQLAVVTQLQYMAYLSCAIVTLLITLQC